MKQEIIWKMWEIGKLYTPGLNDNVNYAKLTWIAHS